jgi:hypothetical protein
LTFDIQILPQKPKDEIVVSPSQIGRWDNCQRWWAWEYIAKIKSPPHPSAVFGTRVHAKLESWLREGTPPVSKPFDSSEDAKASALALRMISTLTNNGIQPGQGEVERYFCFRTAKGHYYNGLIDWSGIVFNTPCVTDHKTSSSISKYGKTEADLHNDVQSVVYSIVGFAGFNTNTLGLLWNYGETKGRGDTKAVKALVHLPIVQEKFESVIEPAVEEIVWHRRAGNHPLTFPPNAASCDMFGGCPHRQRCGLSNQQKLGGLMNNGQPTMAERMGALGPSAGTGFPQQQPPQGYPQQPPQGYPQQGYPQQPPQGYAPPPQQMPGAPMPMLPPQGMPQGMLQGMPQAPQQAYAPNIAPNPPENGVQVPPPPSDEEEGTDKGKSGPGRPKGSRNKAPAAAASTAALSIEQQVFLLGVQGVLANPICKPTEMYAVDVTMAAGELALTVFKKKFGG